MEEIKLCDYGCGKEAKFLFKNGKWCCSSNVNKCGGVIKKRIGQTRSEKQKERMSLSQRGHIPWNKGKKTGQNNWIGKNHSTETKKKISLKKKITIEQIQERYPTFSIIEEMRYNPDKPGEKEIQVHCKNHNCPNSKEQGGWFTPTGNQLDGRRRSLEDQNGTKGSYLYCSNECKQKCFKYYQSLTIKIIQKKYPTFAKIEEMRYNPDKPGEKEIQVHCKNHKCQNSKEQGGWFAPVLGQISERIRQIETGHGGSYLYCSYHCKNECPLFKKSVNQLIKQDLIASGQIEDPWYNSKEYQVWRDKVFELDNSTCQYCGESATIAHHILPQKTHPNLSLDPENGIACCQECHFKYGHRDSWCTTGNLSALVCERIIRIKNKGEIIGHISSSSI